MVVSKGKTPTAQETFLQMAQAVGLRGRLLVTVGVLILVRLGIYLPLPGVDRLRFTEIVKNNAVVNFLDIFSGGGLSLLGIFALGILPFINASIIMQLMTSALPSLENLQRMKVKQVEEKFLNIHAMLLLPGQLSKAGV